MDHLIEKYFLMHQDLPVAVLQIASSTGDVLSIECIMEPSHFPLGVAPLGQTPDINQFRKWWRRRGIPASRHGLEQALAKLQMASGEMLLFKCSGLSLTDQYWVTPYQAPQKWHEVNFFENAFSDDVGKALFEEPGAAIQSFRDPSASSCGNLQKQWKIAAGQRVLLKAGTPPFYQEPLNECVASLVFDRLGIDHVSCTLSWHKGKPLSVCPCFLTKNTEFVTTADILNATDGAASGESLWEQYLSACEMLGIPQAREKTPAMLAADFVLANTDRHLANFGAVRYADSLEWIGIAPIFDTGTSLWQVDQTRFILQDQYLPTKPFSPTQKEQLALLRHEDIASLPWENLHSIGQEVMDILLQSPWIEEARAAAITARMEQQVQEITRITHLPTQQFSSDLQHTAPSDHSILAQRISAATARAADINAANSASCRETAAPEVGAEHN